MGSLSSIKKTRRMRPFVREISTPPAAPSPSASRNSVPAEIMLNVGDDVMINQFGSFTTK